MRLPPRRGSLWRHLRYRWWLLDQPAWTVWHVKKGTARLLQQIVGGIAHTLAGGAPDMEWDEGRYVVVQFDRIEKVRQLLQRLSDDQVEEEAVRAVFLGCYTRSRKIQIFFHGLEQSITKKRVEE